MADEFAAPYESECRPGGPYGALRQIKSRELSNLGIPKGAAVKAAQVATRAASAAGWPRDRIRERLRALVADPASFADDPILGAVAAELMTPSAPTFVERTVAAPWRQWGRNLEPQSVAQLANACRLPVAVQGALMPDAHLGYGLPIGGVLATDNAVIPYAVGVDIACRMKMTVLDLPVSSLTGQADRLVGAIETETRFGIGAKFSDPRDHPVMDEDWTVSPVTQRLRDKAWSQLGTSGSGNHFVEFGLFTFGAGQSGLDADLDAGPHLALLSHSGSRGVGAQVASHYSKVAIAAHPELPKELKHLAWLDLDTHAGAEYWHAMCLMGRYAAANHACIHAAIAKHLGADVLLDVENHHNFAWRETHDIEGEPREVIVHRKGATPAGAGVFGIIPGSMASPGYLVRGRGEPASLESASHGAGRIMSRTSARRSFTWSEAKKLLRERNVLLISAGIDEVPMVYKDIDEVMAEQDDLVEIVGRFDPRIVKMAPDGERAED